jgi:hypothetical protein
VYTEQNYNAEKNYTYKINTNGAYPALGKSIVSKAEQQARLSYSRVTYENQFEQVIIVSLPCHGNEY